MARVVTSSLAFPGFVSVIVSGSSSNRRVLLRRFSSFRSSRSTLFLPSCDLSSLSLSLLSASSSPSLLSRTSLQRRSRRCAHCTVAAVAAIVATVASAATSAIPTLPAFATSARPLFSSVPLSSLSSSSSSSGAAFVVPSRHFLTPSRRQVGRHAVAGRGSGRDSDRDSDSGSGRRRAILMMANTYSSKVMDGKEEKEEVKEEGANTDSDMDARVDIAGNIASVLDRISMAAARKGHDGGSHHQVRLVAVSKTKPVEALMKAYNAGQRVFGENYVQELLSKVNDMPNNVRWHFIGPIQSNKVAPLVRTVGLDRLACVETVSTIKIANKLNKAVEEWVHSRYNDNDKDDKDNEDDNGGNNSDSDSGGGGGGGDSGANGNGNGNKEATQNAHNTNTKLSIYLQVNTSMEESKSGVTPGSDLINLATMIQSTCPYLSIDGLMTIGSPNDYSCFDTLVKCRDEVERALLGNNNGGGGGGDDDDGMKKRLELSMGMSGDFEEAIARGATSVRVGSTIFGARDYSAKSK